MKQSSFDATILVLDVETSAFGAATSAIARRSFDATISALDAKTSSLDAETSERRRLRSRGVTGDIGDCGVAITSQMCNRVTNHGKTLSKPELYVTLDHWVGSSLQSIINMRRSSDFGD